MKKNAHKQSGFTIVEIALVLIVAGSMLAFLGSALLDFQKKRRIDTTEYRLEKISTGMNRYFSNRGKFPCPAAINVNPENTNFGREVNNTDCTGTASGNRGTAAIAGTRLINGARAIAPDAVTNRVRVGSVPVRDLDLPDEMMVDGWGMRFTYAVTINQATIDRAATPELRYSPNGGAIDVVGLGGSIFAATTPGSAHYVVLSHGKDQMGAVNIEDSTVVNDVAIPCTAANTPSGAPNIQNVNCVNDFSATATFLETMHRDDGSYDDFLAYSAPSAGDEDIPSGAVVPFRLEHCPDGWSVFERARGRIVMGIVNADATNGNADDNIVRRMYDPFVPSATTQNMNYPVGQTDNSDSVSAQQQARFNVPPYLALLYCRKN